MSGVYLLPFSFVVAISTSEFQHLALAGGASLTNFTVIAGQLNSRWKIVRPVIWFGYATGCLGYGLCIKYLSYRSGTAAQEIVLIVAAFGIGMSLAVPLLLIQAVSKPAMSLRAWQRGPHTHSPQAMPLKEMAASTGAWLLTRSLGGTLGIAVFQAVLQAGLQSKFPSLEGYGRDFGIPQNLQEYHQIYNLPTGSERDAALTAFSESLKVRLQVVSLLIELGADIVRSSFCTLCGVLSSASPFCSRSLPATTRCSAYQEVERQQRRRRTTLPRQTSPRCPKLKREKRARTSRYPARTIMTLFVAPYYSSHCCLLVATAFRCSDVHSSQTETHFDATTNWIQHGHVLADGLPDSAVETDHAGATEENHVRPTVLHQALSRCHQRIVNHLSWRRLQFQHRQTARDDASTTSSVEPELASNFVLEEGLPSLVRCHYAQCAS